MFPVEKYPYTNFHDLNLGYFLTHFREIFEQWASLYEEMQSWKTATDQELETWKTTVLNDINAWETALRGTLDQWEAEVMAGLEAWKTAFQTLFDNTFNNLEDIKTDAEAARDAALTAQTAAEAAATAAAESAATFTTDTTLSISGRAADAAITGDALNDLKNAALFSENSPEEIWTIGTLLSANGTESDSDFRMRTSILDRSIKCVRVANGYYFSVYAYNSEGTYQGIWNGTTFAKSLPSTPNTKPVYISSLPKDYYYRIVLTRNDEQPISKAECINCIFDVLTDTTLSNAGMSADANVTGLEIDGIKKQLEPFRLINRIDYSDVVIGEVVSAVSGVFNRDSTLITARTGYIDLNGATEIVYSRRTLLVSTTIYGLAFYDENKQFISGNRDKTSQSGRGYIAQTITIPEGARYVAFTLWRNDIAGAYLYNADNYNASQQFDTLLENADGFGVLETQMNSIKSAFVFSATTSDVITKYIEASGIISSLTPSSPRLLVIPVDGVIRVDISINVESTKRYGFCDSLSASAQVYGYTQVEGVLNAANLANDNHKYFVVQLFVNSDEEQSVDMYIRNTVISLTGVMDAYARNILQKNVVGRFYHAESLHSLPILDSFSDITVDSDSFSNCANYHALMNTLCNSSNGFITRTLLGDDGHDNNLYKYVTNPKVLKYGVDRDEYAPAYPITGGEQVKPLTILLTANIHGRERNGNWVIYNLLSKMLNPDSEMIGFFRNRVRFVCVPYICASGTYSNADGININRDFPTTYNGTCVSNEANLVKSVIDEYGEDIFLHIDIHTFNSGSAQDHNTAGWIFTDAERLGERCVVTAESVLDRYHKKYPDIARLSHDYIGSTNIPTTCTYYTQAVYGAPSATMEASLTMPGSPEGADTHTSAVAYFYDIITQTLCSMID